MTELLDTPENWDAASAGYGESVAPLLMEPFAEAFVELLDVSPETVALEVAAGSGAMSEVLARRVGSLRATDFSPQMLEILAQRFERAGIENATCELQDGTNMTLEDGSFDRVLCCFGLMLFPDRAKGFSELRRVLKPGGRAVVAGWAGADKFEIFGAFAGGMRAAFPDLPAPSTPPPVFSLANLATFKAEMEAAGFTDVTTEYVSRELTLDGPDAFWRMLTVGAPPARVLLDRVGESGQQHLKQVLTEQLRARFGDGPMRFTNAATVGVGTAPS